MRYNNITVAVELSTLVSHKTVRQRTKVRYVDLQQQTVGQTQSNRTVSSKHNKSTRSRKEVLIMIIMSLKRYNYTCLGHSFIGLPYFALSTLND